MAHRLHVVPRRRRHGRTSARRRQHLQCDRPRLSRLRRSNPMDVTLRLRQAPGLEISETLDGVLAYQRDRDRVHFLNPTAALVLESCDGTLPVGELPALIASAV